MSKLRPTKVTNLARDEESGIYYARTKVDGIKKIRSLGTTNLSTAKRKLPAVLDKLRLEARPKAIAGAVFELSALYLRESELSPHLAPRTKDFHKEIVEIFRKKWSGPEDVSRITRADTLGFLSSMVEAYAPSRSNALQSLLVWIGKRAHREGLIVDRYPFEDLPRRSPRPKDLNLPSREEMEELLSRLRDRWIQHRGWTYFAVSVISHTGVRQSELNRLTWDDLDYSRRETRVRSAKLRDGKVRGRVVPWIGEFERLLEEIRTFTDAMEIVDPRIIPLNSLNAGFRRAFTDLGTWLTPHDFRHLFATRCIESGVDIQTVSRWLGHSDGGALAMKFYGHLTESHSREMAKRVRI